MARSIFVPRQLLILRYTGIEAGIRSHAISGNSGTRKLDCDLGLASVRPEGRKI